MNAGLASWMVLRVLQTVLRYFPDVISVIGQSWNITLNGPNGDDSYDAEKMKMDELEADLLDGSSQVLCEL
jgi:hypothetical protein